ncbi:MAG: YceD family protein, partial [Acidobacteriota bacterium]
QLDRLGDEPFDWRETLALSTAALDRSEVVSIESLDVSGRLSRLDDGFYLTGTIHYDQTLTCVRCLEPFDTHETIELSLLVVPRAEPSHGDEERELNDDDLGLVFVEDETLDTTPLVAEYVQLEVPMQPLCREDCKSLCETCGDDLNQGPCNCEAPVDPRWAALASLKTKALNKKS